MNFTLLTLHLVLFNGSPRLSGVVELVNEGTTEARIWTTGNQWGDPVLSFETHSNGHSVRIFRKPLVYTRNVPSSRVLSPGAKQVWNFDLTDGSWELNQAEEKSMPAHESLVAIYQVNESPEAGQLGVWVGELRSGSVSSIHARSGLSGID